MRPQGVCRWWWWGCVARGLGHWEGHQEGVLPGGRRASPGGAGSVICSLQEGMWGRAGLGEDLGRVRSVLWP